MKKSQKKILIFEIMIFILIILNSFISSILAKYGIVLLLAVMLFVFKTYFGFEKDRHRFTKDIIFEIVIVLLIFFIIYYFSGIIFKFVRVDNFFTFYGIFTFIVPITLTIILKEYLRYNMLKKIEGSKMLMVTTIIMFVLLDVTNLMSMQNFKTIKTIFIFIALTLLPAISNNIACTYIAKKAGYIPNIIWMLVIKLYYYILPIVPNPSEYIMSLILIILPLVIAYRVYVFMSSDYIIGKKENMKISDFVVIGVLTIFVVIVVYLTSGYFKYYVLSIGSGSMTPNIKVGDAVIIERLNSKEYLEVGDVIAYNYHNVTMVHRIINIVEEKNERYFYTKGDANENNDNYIVYEDMIIGKYKYRIPLLGMPAIWMNNL